MAHDSLHTLNSGGVLNPNTTSFVPFRAYLREVPVEGGGRRWTQIRDLQKTAHIIETELVAAGWNIARPVAFKPQFGNKTAEIVLNGFVGRPDADYPVEAQTTTVNIIHTGTVPGEKTALVTKDPGSGNLSYGQEPSDNVESLAFAIQNALTLDSTYIGESAIIERLEVNGIMFGLNARTMP